MYVNEKGGATTCGVSSPGVYDTLECKSQMSNASTYLNQGAYEDAYTSWKYAYCNCLKGENHQEWIYKAGADIFRHSIKNTAAHEKKRLFQLSDSLVTLYHNWAQAYPERKASSLASMATYTFLYQSDSAERLKCAKEYFEESFNLAPNKINHSTVVYYLATEQKLLKFGQTDTATLASAYLQMTKLVQQRLGETAAEIEKRQRTQSTLDRIATSTLSCSALSQELSKLPNPEKDNYSLVRQTVLTMSKMTCKQDDLLPWLTLLCTNTPNTQCLLSLGKAAFNEDSFIKAMEYYEEAFELSDSNTEKSEILLKVANCMEETKASTTDILKVVNQAIALDPENGPAYYIKAGLYAQMIPACRSEFDQKAGYWVVVDYYLKAMAVNTDLDSNCKAKVETYSAYFPSEQDLFFQTDNEGNTLKTGMQYNVSCLMENTLIRTR